MEGNIASEDDAGLVPRSVRAIFENLQAMDMEFTVRVSFLELYNEELQDLLSTDKSKQLKLCEDLKKGVVCQNLEEITVFSSDQIFDILQRGIKERQTAATLMNKNSSRSHSIFTMKIMIKETNVEGEEVLRHGQLNLVDLAGSECVGRSGAKNERAREAGSINQSLLTLGRVITALVDRHGHIPYRDSKLTRILQESLGGKAKTCIIATLSPSQMNMEESISTLDYAQKAKSIKNIPQANQKIGKKVALGAYCQEIEQLRAMLQATRDKNGVYLDPAQFAQMEQKLESQENQIFEAEAAWKSAKEELKTIQTTVNDLNLKLDATKNKLKKTEGELSHTEKVLSDTKCNLEITEMELQATEAVVGEQIVTEKDLTKQANDFSKEIDARRNDVDNLLGKVDRVMDIESKRIKLTKTFTSDLTTSSNELLSVVKAITENNNAQSSALQDGVKELLSSGRNTCSELKEAIQGSLKTLLGDASAAKDAMNEQCNQLDGHLKSTNTTIASTLNTLQGNLSSWLEQVDQSLTAVQSKLEQQQKSIIEATGNMKQGFVSLQEISSVFESSQVALMNVSAENAVNLRSELSKHLDDYKEQEETRIASAKEALQMKADEIENTMKSMMESMMKESMAAFTEKSKKLGAFTTSMKKMANSKLSEMENVVKSNSVTITDHADMMKNAIEMSTNSNQEAFSVIETARSDAMTDMSEIGGSVEGKRTDLNTTVRGVCTDLDVAIDEACTVVESTSQRANKVLKDIGNATESMRGSSYNSIDNFTSLLDGKGDGLSKSMGDHFTALTCSLSSQSSILSNMEQCVSSHMESSDIVVTVPTGSTPKKAKYAVLPPLCETRAHDIIKEEARVRKPSSSHVDMVARSRCVSDDSLASASLNSSGEPMTADAPSAVTTTGEEEALEPPAEPISREGAITKKRKATGTSAGAENDDPQVDNGNRVSRSKSVDTVDSASSAEDVKDTTASASTKTTTGIKKTSSKMPRSKRAAAI